MARIPEGFAHQFEDMEQQREAGSLGMWVFLVTEIMFFGGLFATYIIYRSLYLPSFEIGSRLLNVKFGAANTAVLIGSSLTMALAIHAAQAGKKKSEQVMYLVLTMILGAALPVLEIQFRVACRLCRTPDPRIRLHHSPRVGRRRPACPHVFLLLLLHDRLARAAHDYRVRHPQRPDGHGLARPL